MSLCFLVVKCFLFCSEVLHSSVSTVLPTTHYHHFWQPICLQASSGTISSTSTWISSTPFTRDGHTHSNDISSSYQQDRPLTSSHQPTPACVILHPVIPLCGDHVAMVTEFQTGNHGNPGASVYLFLHLFQVCLSIVPQIKASLTLIHVHCLLTGMCVPMFATLSAFIHTSLTVLHMSTAILVLCLII